MTVKEFLEVAILLIGGGGGATIAGFTFAVYQEKQRLEQLKLQIKDGQLEFARKVQKNIDSNQVEIGILKGEVDDIKAMMQGTYQARTRPAFPPENKPKHTGWTIEDA